MIRARALWLKVHLYLALIGGGFIVILALTGSILTYHPELDRLLNPPLRHTTAWPPHITADEAVGRVETALHLRPALIWMPQQADNTYVAELFDPAESEYRLVTIDAGNGHILANRIWGRTFVTLLLELHTGLLLGERGLPIVGILAIALLMSAFTGLYLWWPRSMTPKTAFLPRPVRHALSLNFDIHRLSGLYLLPAIIVIATAGVSFAFPGMFAAATSMFALVSEDTEEQSPTSSVPSDPSVGRRSLAEVERSLARDFPGARVISISLPGAAEDPYAVRLVDVGEPDNRNGRSTVWIDAYSGKVLRDRLYSRKGAGDRFVALQLPLHTGEYFGSSGRIIAALAGLAICVLYGTGLYLWLKRSRRTKRLSRTPSV